MNTKLNRNLTIGMLPVTISLPDDLLQEIGRIVVFHSYLEYILGKTVYELLGLNPKQGRIAIRDPRSDEIATMIGELAKIDGLTLTHDMGLLAETLIATKNERDAVAHGIWLKEPIHSRILLRRLKGNWQPFAQQKGSIKRRIQPEGVDYDAKRAKEAVALINEAIRLAKNLHGEIHARLTMPGKPAKSTSEHTTPQRPVRTKRSRPRSVSRKA